MLAGSGAVVVGIAWSIWLPMNKSLWTSSYALFTAGLATVVFAACYWLVEIRGHAAVARPFAVLGVNALALFFLSTATAHVLTLLRAGDGSLQRWLFQHAFASWASPYNASLAYALAYLLVWWGAMWLLDRAGLRLRA
jgi:predicted acyltransferase